MLDPWRITWMRTVIGMIFLALVGFMMWTLWHDPQSGQAAYSYYGDTKQINSNDLSTGIVGYYTRAIFIVTAALSLVAVIQIGFLIRADKNARDAMVAEQRAFVFAFELIPEWRKNDDGSFSWIVRPVWQNSGKTPTKKLRIATWGELRERQISADLDPNQWEGGAARGLIGPRSKGNGPPWPVDNQLSQRDFLDVIAGRKFLYLWGYAKYFDVFDNSDERFTKFCWLLTPTGDPMTVPEGFPCPVLNWKWIQHAKGNCADEADA